ncbi:ABC transporter substrate-binding protein [Xanthobacter sp. KR7-225]|uniref:ABC transporter substrate-binding protein n=1 Tax=Xanthobacter sp. KR7-225 TaxID=3156613 RepID=UPI0032B4D271
MTLTAGTVATAIILACTTGVLAQSAKGSAPPDVVKIGINGVVSDAPFFIAETKGFFGEAGIKVEFIAFDAGPKMIAPLGAGQIDVAGGASSAGLFNAVGRGINIQIVADRGSTPPGHEYVPIIVRKDLVDSGRVKTYADLKGLKVAEAGQGGAQSSLLNEALKSAGLSFGDVEHVYISYPQQVSALANKAVDAAVTAEPSASQAVLGGHAVRMIDSKVYPNQQVAVLLYGGDFIAKRPDVAARFMVAYLKGARIYNDALKDGHFAGPAGDEVIAILIANTKIKDKALYQAIVPSGINPDGAINEDSLRKDVAFYQSQKYLESRVDVSKVVNLTFRDQALKALGPYRPSN